VRTVALPIMTPRRGSDLGFEVEVEIVGLVEEGVGGRGRKERDRLSGSTAVELDLRGEQDYLDKDVESEVRGGGKVDEVIISAMEEAKINRKVSFRGFNVFLQT